ncbi:S-adenosyl-L-methionine-dependent methyltransferase [Fennellomyces sp. T-0311]|nr:S-adenosyl-L-methionine-dependent methyltransferase [Fennellomyces sp. T-0311]
MLEYAKSLLSSLFTGKRTQDEREYQEVEADSPGSKRIRTEDGESEEVLHRLRISNFNKHDWKKVKKHLVDLGLKPMSKAPKWNYGIITASSEEDALDMIKKMEGTKYKNKELTVEHVREKQDTYRKRMEKLQKKKDGGKPKPAEEDDNRTPAEKLADQVTPFHKMPYDKQLLRKNDKGTNVLAKLKLKLRNIPAGERNDSIDQVKWAQTKGRLPCKMEDPIPSPDMNGYRTKCEFTIGKDLDGKPTVGFLLGLYKLGITAVLDPSDCLNVPDIAKRIAAYMQEYISNSEYEAYDRVAKTGQWRTLMTKTQRTGEVMVVIQMKTAGLSEEQVADEKKKLIEYWNSFRDKPEDERLVVTTLLFQAWDGDSNGMTDRAPLEVLIGDGIVHEELLGCKFRISSSAFFQVNTPAAEVLYSKCAEWCNINKDKKTTLLDLCCGTGTIGITMASAVDKVIGIEMVPEAIEDAKRNAALNNITNVTYYANKVEDRIDVIEREKNEDVVAVLDPPRSGVHSSVIQTIRSSAVNRVIYISCDSKQALGNFYGLCKPSSKRFTGEPFRPSRAITIDLFPHTDHCELMVEFVRGEYLKDLDEAEATTAEQAIAKKIEEEYDTVEAATADKPEAAADSEPAPTEEQKDAAVEE